MYKIKALFALLISKAYVLITDKEIRSQVKKEKNAFDAVLRIHSMKELRNNLDTYILSYEEDITKE